MQRACKLESHKKYASFFYGSNIIMKLCFNEKWGKNLMNNNNLIYILISKTGFSPGNFPPVYSAVFEWFINQIWLSAEEIDAWNTFPDCIII